MIDGLIKQFADSFMKMQGTLNKLLIGVWVWMSFYLAYKETNPGGSPTFPDMVEYIILFIVRPIQFVVDKLFYT